ncbi:MAG: serine/threonine protein kinase [Planctomycetes bacterium]|nr:serine/threonine protein kinase [Planctomycetota bacterium]
MTEDPVLSAILDCLDRGETPSADDLDARFPDEHETVARHLRVLHAYRQMRSIVRGHDGHSPNLAAGRRLGDFEVVGPHARGGMGSVYLARQTSLGSRLVALKAMSALGCSASDRERFHREALAVASLQHPRLAEVHGFGEEDDVLYFAMRYVRGPTLREVIARHGRPADHAARLAFVGWAADVASALGLAHRRGMVHRDVKPDNIVIEDEAWRLASTHDHTRLPRGPATLVDFGLAREVERARTELTTVHRATIEYAAPEQLLLRHVDPRSDVFSLGVTLHDALCGRLPHAGDRARPRPEATTQLKPLREEVRDVDPDLDAVVGKALEHHVSDRYPDGDAFEADLRALLDGRAVSAARSPLIRRVRRFARERPVLLLRRILGGTLLLVVLVLLAAVTLGVVDAGRRAAIAARDGQVLQLVDGVRRLPAFDLPFVDEDVLAFARRLRERAPGDPLVALADAALRGDEIGALRQASTALALEGAPRANVALAFLRGRLERTLVPVATDDEVAARSARASADATWTEASRLAVDFESDDAVPFPTGSLTDLARRALDADALPPRTRALSRTVLSAWGDARDLETIVEHGLLEPIGSDGFRQSMSVAARITRRLLRTGRTDTLAAERLEELLAELTPAIVEALSDPDALRSFDARRTSLLLASLLAVCARAHGGSRALEGLLRSPAGAIDDLLPVAGALGSTDLLEARIPAVFGEAERERVTPLGVALGMLGDGPLIEDVARRLERSPALAPSTVDDFRRKVDAAHELARGVDPESRPDEDTRLDTSRAPLLQVPLHPDPLAACDLDPGLRERGWTVSDAAAAWVFGCVPPCRVGTAGDPLLSGASLEADGTAQDPVGYVRMGRFGMSSLTLPFTGPPAERLRAWTIRIHAQQGARQDLPFQGEVLLRVLLDGERVVDGLLVDDDVPGLVAFDVRPERIHPGARHTLRIELDRASTTTVRLQALAIVPRTIP